MSDPPKSTQSVLRRVALPVPLQTDLHLAGERCLASTTDWVRSAASHYTNCAYQIRFSRWTCCCPQPPGMDPPGHHIVWHSSTGNAITDSDECWYTILWYTILSVIMGNHYCFFKCSHQYHGQSLNQCLEPGPTIGASLLGVLIRFMEHPVALSGDIKAMLYQVRLFPEDCPLLWFPLAWTESGWASSSLWIAGVTLRHYM